MTTDDDNTIKKLAENFITGENVVGINNFRMRIITKFLYLHTTLMKNLIGYRVMLA